MKNKSKGSELVVKTNSLVMAIQKLTISETRLMQLAIIEARSNGALDHGTPIYIHAETYAETFNTTAENGYKALLEAETKLFERRFQFISELGNPVKSRWVTSVEYIRGEYTLKIKLSDDLINEVTKIDGYKQFFTSYRLEQTSELKSVYSIRLFELLIQNLKIGKVSFDLDVFRLQIGIEADEYVLMSNFKKFVLDSSVEEINKKTDLKIGYEQHKQGRKIVGFTFDIKTTKKTKPKRTLVSISEAIDLSQTVVKGGFVGETDFDAIGRVMSCKDENGNAVYEVDSSPEKWAEFNAQSAEKAKKREVEAQGYKWVTIGNTRLDDDYIDAHRLPNESDVQARLRLKKLLENQLTLDLENDDIPEHVRFANKKLNRSDAERLGKVGEDWDTLKSRLLSEGYTLNF